MTLEGGAGAKGCRGGQWSPRGSRRALWKGRAKWVLDLGALLSLTRAIFKISTKALWRGNSWLPPPHIVGGPEESSQGPPPAFLSRC